MIKVIYSFLKKVNIFKTIYWNLRLFEFNVAKHFPIFIGYGVQFTGVSRGSIKLRSQNPKIGSVRIGITDFPQFPTKNISTMIRLNKGSWVEFGDNVRICGGCSIVASFNGSIVFGNNVFMNMYTMAYSNARIEIGDNIRIGWRCQIYDSNFHYMINVKNGDIKSKKRNIVISDNVWVANHVTVGPGAKIPPFTTVAAFSLVNRDFMNHSEIGGLLVGTPATYKLIDSIRIMNESIENIINNKNIPEDDKININQLGYNVLPIDSGLNPLYRVY